MWFEENMSHEKDTMDLTEYCDKYELGVPTSSQTPDLGDSLVSLYEKWDHMNILTSTSIGTNIHPLMDTFSPNLSDQVFEEEINQDVMNKDVEENTKNRCDNYDQQLEIDAQLFEEMNKLPDIPDSPSALKRIMCNFPVEVSNTDLSDTENDKSIYEAHLSSNLENVCLAMNQKQGNLNFLAHNKRSNKLRKIKVMDNDIDDGSDISSLDSVSESLKSENVFHGHLEINDPPPEQIEPLTADEERNHARCWQLMNLPDGEERVIDLRVIEPYKRVLSHGGYLRAGGHTAIVVFSACYLPDKSRVDYVYVMNNLFLYILWTLERLVTDDYVLVYLNGGATNLPAFSWIKKCYQMIGRKLRKNLSHLYLVHPSLWIKTMLFMAKPFISSKFYRKISYIGTLKELIVRIPLELAAVPDKVKAYDTLHCGI